MDRTGGAVIDLGLDRSEPEPVWRGPRYGWPRWPQLAAALVCAVLAGTLLGGAVPSLPPPSPLELVASRNLAGENFQVIGDLLVVAESTARPGYPVWAAHQLPSGRRLWAAPDRPAQLVGDDLVLTVDSGGPGQPNLDCAADGSCQAPGRTFGRDAGTGQPIWSVPAPVEVASGAAIGLARYEFRVDSGQVLHHRIDGIDLTSGAVRWSVRSAAGWRWLAGEVTAVGAAMVALDAGGTAEVRDLVTGAVRARVDLAASGPGPGGFLLVGEQVLLVHGDQPAQVRAYRLGTLAPLWRRSPAGPTMSLGSCGPLVCWQDADGAEVLDPVTGQRRWRPSPAMHLRLVGDLLVAFEGTSGVVWAVVDPATGRPFPRCTAGS